MNKTIKIISVFMGTVFSLFIMVFGLGYVYSAAIGTNSYWVNLLYFLAVGLLCLVIGSTALFLSVKLYRRR
ncbi:hypothetical protein BH23THE1_BH23THE1_35790 [soil metagenome]